MLKPNLIECSKEKEYTLHKTIEIESEKENETKKDSERKSRSNFKTSQNENARKSPKVPWVFNIIIGIINIEIKIIIIYVLCHHHIKVLLLA